ncbi:unnamed protein product [Sympodiomycopsis kandeliae]
MSPTKPAMELVDQDANGLDLCVDSRDTTMDDDDANTSESGPSVWGRLEVINKKGKVQGTLPIVDRECTIGRSSENDLRCCEIGVSRRACKITFETPQRARLIIVGSNKVTINDQGVSLGSTSADQMPSQILASGDTIGLQKYRFRFSYEPAARRPAILVPSSPSQSSQPNTPNSKTRKIRMSLVDRADIQTPNKISQEQRVSQQAVPPQSATHSSPSSDKAKRRVSLLAPGDTEATNNQARVMPFANLTNESDVAELKQRGRQSIAIAPSTPQRRGAASAGEEPRTEPRNQRSRGTDLSLQSDDQSDKDQKDVAVGDLGHSEAREDRRAIDDDVDGADEYVDEVVVFDDNDEQEEQLSPHIEASNASREDSTSRSDMEKENDVATRGLGIANQESSPKLRRKSSILESLWPFGSPTATNKTNESAPVSQSADNMEWEQDQRTDSQETEGKTNTSMEEEAEVEGAEDLLPPLEGSEPRLPRSLSSPGRLASSPSFHLDGRRKVSLRTRTLLKSSAVLAEKLEAESELSPLAEDSTPQSLTENVLGEPFAEQAASADDRQYDQRKIRHDNLKREEERDDEFDDDDSDEDEDEIEQSLRVSEDEVPELYSQTRPSAYKRMSLPASSLATRRFSLFGGLPKLRSSSEAEDVVDATRTERMGHARRKSSFEPSATTNGDLLRAPRDPSLSEAAYASLRMPAREALRYLLSKKAANVTSPKAEQVPSSPALSLSALSPNSAATPLAPPSAIIPPGTPKYGALRELMLGRPENVELLEQARATRRRSLGLSPSTAAKTETPPTVSTPVMASAVTLQETPDVAFLQRAIQLPEEDIEGDAYLKALRHTFRLHKDTLVREDLYDRSGPETEALVTLLGTPAAHRALLGAAASVGRLSPHESALQAASLARDGMPKHKKTRRGCRGGRRRSKSHTANSDDGQGEDQSQSPLLAGGLAPPLEILEGNEQEGGLEGAVQAQDIQHLLDRLGPLVLSSPDPQATTLKDSTEVALANGDAARAGKGRKTFAAGDKSFDDVETDAEDDDLLVQSRTTAPERRRSVKGHTRGASLAATAATSSASHTNRRRSTAGPIGAEKNVADRDESASVASSEGSNDQNQRRSHGRQTAARSKEVKGGKQSHQVTGASATNALPSKPKSQAQKLNDEKEATSERDVQTENVPNTRNRPARGVAPAPSNGSRNTRHTRTKSNVTSEGPTSPVQRRHEPIEHAQSSPVKPSSNAKRGPAKGAGEAKSSASTGTRGRGAGGAGGRGKKGASNMFDAPSSDGPSMPESEPAGMGGPTTRLRSGKVVRAAR